MKFLTLVGLLSTASASALPNSNRMQSRPRLHSAFNADISPRAAGAPFYSPNWAGAVYTDSGFHYVEGTFTVPKVSGKGNAAAAAWVGIDGADCPQAILQTGVSFFADGHFEAWYEWFPAYSHTWDNFKVKAGDKIKMVVDATSLSSGTASLENLTTGQKVSQTIPKAPAKICGTTAEWVVEDFTNSGHMVPFADFGSITISNAMAKGSKGIYTPQGADLFDIRDDNTMKVSTNCAIHGSSVSCNYVK
ncbi:hypothetical protein E4U55_001251 [Claviceps digitariae]|nr:hypothetical protein E4U55_001251 [Claviceps digitariae]